MHLTLKALIWLYVVLLLGEGALRKWVLPGWSDSLLLVRDPVVVLIYACSLSAGLWQQNRWIVAIMVLAILCTVASALGGHFNPLVIGYGLRTNFGHLPLIWIIGQVMDRRDLRRMGIFMLAMAVPMTVLMVEQFRAPMDAWINRGVGASAVGQIFGADGRIRPPGLFSFITGPQLYYPLCAAFFLGAILEHRRLPWPFLVLTGVAVVVALPVSISRTAMLGTLLVAGAFVIALPFTTVSWRSLLVPVLALVMVGVAISRLAIFAEGMEVFMMRWDTAASGSGAWEGVMQRTVSGFTNPTYFIQAAPWLGHGIGTGSNVGSRLLTGSVGFLLAEEEWGKVILELGPVLGLAFIGLRGALTGWLGLLAWRALRHRREPLAWLLFAATAPPLLQGQWAPPTVLGFAVLGAGLILAAVRPEEAPVAVDLPAHGAEQAADTVVLPSNEPPGPRPSSRRPAWTSRVSP